MQSIQSSQKPWKESKQQFSIANMVREEDLFTLVPKTSSTPPKNKNKTYSPKLLTWQSCCQLNLMGPVKAEESWRVES